MRNKKKMSGLRKQPILFINMGIGVAFINKLFKTSRRLYFAAIKVKDI